MRPRRNAVSKNTKTPFQGTKRAGVQTSRQIYATNEDCIVVAARLNALWMFAHTHLWSSRSQNIASVDSIIVTDDAQRLLAQQLIIRRTELTVDNRWKTTDFILQLF